MSFTNNEVACLAQICAYGVGNRDMGKAVIDRRHNCKYSPGEKPYFLYGRKPQNSSIIASYTTHHVWWVKYISKEVLFKIYNKAEAIAHTRRKIVYEATAFRASC